MRTFFILCSGSDTDWLERCPKKEVNKHSAIGSLVFMTGLFAFLTGTYSMYSLLSVDMETGKRVFSLSVFSASVGLGMVWGMFIFLLDRFLVSTISKNSPWYSQLLSLTIRLALACLISITVSQPLEVLFFSTRITEQMGISADEATDRVLKQQKDAVDSADHQLQVNQTVLKDALKHGATQSSLEKELEAQLRACNTQCQYLRELHKQELTSLSKRMADDRESAMRLESRISNLDVDDPNLQRELSTVNARLKSNRTEHSRLNQIVSSTCTTCEGVVTKLLAATTKRVEATKTTQSGFTPILSMDSISKEIALEDLNRQKAISDSIHRIAFSENIITQLEALYKYLHVSSDHPEYETRKRSSYGYLLLILIFLIVEIAPILSKVLSSKGEYELIEAHYLKTFVNQLEKFEEERVKRYTFEYERQTDEHESIVHQFYSITTPLRLAFVQQLITEWNATWNQLKKPFRELTNEVSLLLEYDIDVRDNREYRNRGNASSGTSSPLGLSWVKEKLFGSTLSGIGNSLAIGLSVVAVFYFTKAIGIEWEDVKLILTIFS
ncbi:MAG: DUF4407 domain-containing protein [Flavobacteriales bacterium]|nr:DUF4407 domain-containing protein [Flavobacteriales bacterium]